MPRASTASASLPWTETSERQPAPVQLRPPEVGLGRTQWGHAGLFWSRPAVCCHLLRDLPSFLCCLPRGQACVPAVGRTGCSAPGHVFSTPSQNPDGCWGPTDVMAQPGPGSCSQVPTQGKPWDTAVRGPKTQQPWDCSTCTLNSPDSPRVDIPGEHTALLLTLASNSPHPSTNLLGGLGKAELLLEKTEGQGIAPSTKKTRESQPAPNTTVSPGHREGSALTLFIRREISVALFFSVIIVVVVLRLFFQSL